MCFYFFFNDTATTEIYTLSLHDALPIWDARRAGRVQGLERQRRRGRRRVRGARRVLDHGNDPGADLGPDRRTDGDAEHGAAVGGPAVWIAGEGRPEHVHQLALCSDLVVPPERDDCTVTG